MLKTNSNFFSVTACKTFQSQLTLLPFFHQKPPDLLLFALFLFEYHFSGNMYINQTQTPQ